MAVAPQLNEDLFGTKVFTIVFTIRDSGNTVDRTDAGYLEVTANGGATITGNQTSTLTIVGTQAQCNTSMANLNYVPSADFEESVGVSYAQSNDTDAVTHNDFMLMSIRNTHDEFNISSVQFINELDNILWDLGNITDMRVNILPDIQYTLTLTLSNANAGSFALWNNMSNGVFNFTGTKEECNEQLSNTTFILNDNFYESFSITYNQLRITDGIDHGDQLINVVINAPLAEYSYLDNGTQTITFTDLSRTLQGTLTNWKWEYSDGSISTDQNPVKQFNELIWNLPTKLTVTNSLGYSNEITKFIKVMKWEEKNFGSGYPVTDISYVGNNTWIIVCSDGQALRSVNNGINWQNMVPDGLNSGAVSANFVKVSSDLKGVVIAIAQDGYATRSTDYGVTWEALDKNLDLPGVYFTSLSNDNNGVWIAAGGITNLQGSAAMSRSIDNGVTWSNINLSFSNAITSIATDSKGNWIAGAAQVDSGLTNGIRFLSSDNGNGWIRLTQPDLSDSGTFYDINYFNGTWLLVGSNFVNLNHNPVEFRSIDNGNTLTSIGGPTDPNFTDTFINTSVVSDNTSTWVITSDKVFSAWNKIDGLGTWYPTNAGGGIVRSDGNIFISVQKLENGNTTIHRCPDIITITP